MTKDEGASEHAYNNEKNECSGDNNQQQGKRKSTERKMSICPNFKGINV